MLQYQSINNYTSVWDDVYFSDCHSVIVSSSHLKLFHDVKRDKWFMFHKFFYLVRKWTWFFFHLPGLLFVSFGRPFHGGLCAGSTVWAWMVFTWARLNTQIVSECVKNVFNSRMSGNIELLKIPETSIDWALFEAFSMCRNAFVQSQHFSLYSTKSI